MAAGILVAAALGAGALGALYLHSSFAAVSAHPWSIASGAPGTEAGIVWFVSSLAVLRGAWLGSTELSSKHVTVSLGLAAVAFAVFFSAETLHRNDPLLRAQLHPAVVLLLLAFPVAIALVAVVNERDLERSVSHEGVARARLAWIVAIVVPMGAVAALAGLLIIVAGPGLPLIAHLLRVLAHWMIVAADDLFTWITSWFHLRAKVLPPPTKAGGGSLHERIPRGGAPLWIAILAASMAAGVLLAMLWFCFRTLRQLVRRRQRRVRTATVDETEERDSVFSWSHLLDQIRALLARWRDGHRHVADGPAAIDLDQTLDLGATSVRRHYLQLLVAARAAGLGRRASETSTELRDRLTSSDVSIEGDRLKALTAVYERARYGEQLESDAERIQAGQDARLLVDALVASREPTASPEAVKKG
jgi:hypothetical protein